jgi:hypothetical protein
MSGFRVGSCKHSGSDLTACLREEIAVASGDLADEVVGPENAKLAAKGAGSTVV